MENPAVPLSDPDDATIEVFGGGRSTSGVAVNPESALTHPAVWRAVNLIAFCVAKLPLVVYRRVGDGKEKDVAHPSYYILRYKANEWMTAFMFRLALQGQALLRGNGYAIIERDGFGNVTGLLPLDSTKITPRRYEGRYFYEYESPLDGQRLSLDPSMVLHLRGFGDGFEGKSVIAKARESIGAGMAANKYAAVFFKNSARPSAVLEHPAHLGKEAAEQLRASWEAIHTDLDNKHRIAVLEEGMKLNPFGMTNEDAQFLQTREFGNREVANWFGLPPHKLGDPARTSFASLEEENQSYLDDGIDPWLANWESECWDKLLTETEKKEDTKVVEFTRQALARANMKDRGAFYNTALQSGWMNRDEVRSRENLNPIPDGEGKQFFVPVNMGLTGQVDGQGTPPAQQPSEPAPQSPGGGPVAAASAGRALLSDLVSRIVRRLTLTARRRAKDGDTFMDWLDGELEAEHRPVSLEAAIPVVEFIRAARAAGVGSPTAEDLVGGIFGQVREALLTAAEVAPKDLPASVKAVCERLEAALPSTMAGKLIQET